MSVRDIQTCLPDMYGVDVSEGLISQAARTVMDEVVRRDIYTTNAIESISRSL